MIAYHEFEKKLLKEAPQKFTARYYGTRDLAIFPPEFLNYVNECTSFIDITAGGGRFVYDQALKGHHIGANDRCFYAYCALFSVLQHRCQSESWLEKMWNETHPENQGSNWNGIFTSMQKTHVNDQVRNYVDALCITHQNDPFVLYCLGKALRSIFTYRGLSWRPQTPFGSPSQNISPEYIHNFLMKTAWTTNLYSERVQRVSEYDHQVFGCDALVAIQSFSMIQGALVYADPAWPWIDKNGSNPYKWLSEDLSCILAQREIKISFWTRNFDLIMSECSKWIQMSFEMGACYFALCGQDTNFPPLEEIRAYLDRNFNLVRWIEVEDNSKAAHRKYKTAWGIVQC